MVNKSSTGDKAITGNLLPNCVTGKSEGNQSDAASPNGEVVTQVYEGTPGSKRK